VIGSSVADNPFTPLTVPDDDGIVVSKVEKGDGRAMRATSVPQALRERLGHDATMGLLEFTSAEHAAWSDGVINIGVERFERRLAEELGELRVALVREIHETRSETIKWAFIFWVSQVSAFAGLLIFVFRNAGR
jgi:hypothetical protein